MLVFGHIGITIGIAVTIANIRVNGQADNDVAPQVSIRSVSKDDRQKKENGKSVFGYSALLKLSQYLDIRLLIIGSLLPDIIDKPLGHYILGDTISNGRIFSHTLLFLVLLAAAGVYLQYRHRSRWMLTLAAGTLSHLILDQMWETPETLLWPLLGTSFPKADLTGWLRDILMSLVSSPETYVPELAGSIIIIWFLYVVLRSGQPGSFPWNGRVKQISPKAR